MPVLTVEQAVDAELGPLYHYYNTVKGPDKVTIDAVTTGLSEGEWASLISGYEWWIDMLLLKMLTERPTEEYAVLFSEASKRENMPGFGSFAKSWRWDELRHYLPYKALLMEMGFSEDDLERRMRDNAGNLLRYDHSGGLTVVKLAAYGREQEQLTANWDELNDRMFKFFEATEPRIKPARRMNGFVKGREVIHTLVYGSTVHAFVKADRAYVDDVAEELRDFEMPGHKVAPEEQAKVPELVAHFGSNQMHKQSGDVVEDLFEALDRDVELLGRAVYPYAASNNLLPYFNIGPIDIVGLMASAFRKLSPSRFYGFVGRKTLALYGRDASEKDSRYARIRENIPNVA